MISLHRLDDGLVGGLDCGLVGALDDAQVVLAVDWTIERTMDSLVDWVGDLLVHCSTHRLGWSVDTIYTEREEPVLEAPIKKKETCK